jgi:hypothetical protein
MNKKSTHQTNSAFEMTVNDDDRILSDGVIDFSSVHTHTPGGGRHAEEEEEERRGRDQDSMEAEHDGISSPSSVAPSLRLKRIMRGPTGLLRGGSRKHSYTHIPSSTTGGEIDPDNNT